MSPKDRLESAVEKLERRFKACPDDRFKLAAARLMVSDLGDRNSRKRAEVREEILALGKPALPALLSALTDSKTVIRWQAAKALSDVHDPETAPDLINAMEDKDFGVRWLAAEGLIAMGPACLENVLEGLRLRFHSGRTRDGAQHILHVLVDDGYGNEAIEDLLQVLQHAGTDEEVAWAAEKAWESVRNRGSA
jgi:HEAT repeat protein